MSTVIDISVDISKAETLIAETLVETLKVEGKVAKLQAELKVTEDGLNLNDDIMRELEVRAKNVTDINEFHRIQAEVIDEFLTLEEARIEAAQRKQSEIEQKQKVIDASINASNNRALANFRRTAAFGTYVFQALGVSIGQSLTLLAETVSLSVETAQFLLQLDIAEAFASPYKAAVTIGTVGARLILIASLLQLGIEIAHEKEKSSQEFQSFVGAMRILTI